MRYLYGGRDRLAATWARMTTGRGRPGGPSGSGDSDRGDVPGWVMVTVMSAILVVAILGVFEPQIKSAITHAIDSVTNSGS
jgi:hypothetical protein